MGQDHFDAAGVRDLLDRSSPFAPVGSGAAAQGIPFVDLVAAPLTSHARMHNFLDNPAPPAAAAAQAIPFLDLGQYRTRSWRPSRAFEEVFTSAGVHDEEEGEHDEEEEQQVEEEAPAELPTLVLFEAFCQWPVSPRRGKKGKEERSMVDLPDEILTIIFKAMSSVKELVSVMQTCRRFYRLCLPDEIWDFYAPRRAIVSLFLHADKGCPRMLSYKNQVLSDRISEKSFRNNSWVHVFMRRVMYISWESCGPNWSEEEKQEYFYAPDSAAMFFSALDGLDLSLVYETLDVIFTDMTDYIASALLSNFGVKSEAASVQGEQGGATDPVMTTRLWEAVLIQWRRYDRWLKRAAANTEKLHKGIMAQRQTSHNWGRCPTLHEKGSTHFRNQVVLRFGLRFPLQEGQKWLLQQYATGSASPWQTWLLDWIWMLLKDLDVPEDLGLSMTMSRHGYTRLKLMRCFFLEEAASSFMPAMPYSRSPPSLRASFLEL